MATVLLGAGLTLALALLVAIHRKLDDLVPRLAAVARRERDEGRAQALTVLSEAAAVKVAALTRSLRDYEEQRASDFRAQVAAAQNRMRVVERRSSDASVALSAASELVRELRALLTDPRAQAAHADDPESRPTVEIGPRVPEDDDEPEEELTKVTVKPLPGTQGAANGLRLVPDAPPPSPKSPTRGEGA